jgi:hypothetical protein
MFSPYIKSLKAIDYDSAQNPQRELLDTALNQVGFIPNMYSNMGGVSKSMLKQSRLNFDKIEKCE